MQARNWVFTINNYNIHDILFLEENLINYSYCIIGLEVGEQGTHHLQGYMEFTGGIRFDTLKKAIPNAHFETRRGTQEQAITYCKKDEEWLEWGKRKEQGKRSDLIKAMELVKQGTKTIEIMEEIPETYSRNMKFIEKYNQLIEKENTKEFRKVEVEVLTGPAGCGKTKKAFEEAPDLFTVNPDETFPFDGYNGEKTILIDDFYGDIKYHHILRILDGHQLRINVKGGHRYAQWTKIFITSNDKPENWYKRGLTPALKRRLTTITDFATATEVNATQVAGNTMPPQYELEDNILDI